MRYLFPLSPWLQQRQFEKPVWVFPVHLAMFATYLRNKGNKVIWDGEDDGTFDKVITDDVQIDVPFTNLPFPDRVFTNGKDPRTQNYGNFKYRPNTHMMASNLCWYGRCTFCIDTEKLKTEKRGLRTVDHCMEEIDDLIRQGYKEVFDDSGTFPLGKWLNEFCVKMLVNGRRNKIKVGCNMRVGEAPWETMAGAGFRFVLVGIESANQITLDKIKKSTKADETIEDMKRASKAGIDIHATFMTGYPWETEKDERRTIELCHYLLKKGYIKTAQASVYSPPRTSPSPDSVGHKYLPRFYDVYKSPEFILRKISDIRRWEDFTYLLRGARLVLEEKCRKGIFSLTTSLKNH